MVLNPNPEISLTAQKKLIWEHLRNYDLEAAREALSNLKEQFVGVDTVGSLPVQEIIDRAERIFRIAEKSGKNPVITAP